MGMAVKLIRIPLGFLSIVIAYREGLLEAGIGTTIDCKDYFTTVDMGIQLSKTTAEILAHMLKWCFVIEESGELDMVSQFRKLRLGVGFRHPKSFYPSLGKRNMNEHASRSEMPQVWRVGLA